MDDKIVLHMRDKRPVWAMPDWVEGEIRAAVPDGWSVAIPDQLTDGSGDGASSSAPSAVLDLVRGARIYMGFGIPADVLRAGSMLEWVHSGAAGVGESLTREMIESDVVFTNSAGIHGPPIAETVLAMILHFFRGLDFAVEGRRRRTWWNEPFLAEGSPVRELAGAVVGILGYGGVGKEVASRLAGLGARVLALRRSATAENSDTCAELYRGSKGLNEILDLSDAVVVCLPETEDTRALVDEDFLGRVKRGSVFVNVGRGRIVDEDALLQSLRSGHLRGAALDVTRTEPLPADHPLWDAPNLLITPHVSAVTRKFWRRETALILDNLERFFKGVPLRNRVDKEAGY